MFRGNNSNFALPISLNENRFQYTSNTPNNQLQLLGNLPTGCTIDPVNYLGNQNNSSMLWPEKRGWEADDLSGQQKLQISLNYNICQDEFDQSASIPNQNPVSTGLRLSYDDDERKSSVTSASRSMGTPSSILLSLGDDVRTELERQKEEFDQFIKIQEEHLAKGVRDMRQRHMASFLSAIEKGISKKLSEKELELENMNCNNRELTERIKQVANEAQTWHNRAKHNESIVNVLKGNLQQAISLGVDQGKEGFGDCEVDDAASYIDPSNNYIGFSAGCGGKAIIRAADEHIACKACRRQEVSVLLMPCRHLCVCKDWLNLRGCPKAYL
ncbi:hypothetical protein Nepgr_029488 [Nepenthes gracilis]|uniref:Uncharacterized protein n=1 Tax=Nepenthes gracilis TaxID=150966 RepID=A0AAD3Y4W3_NEPGR|nr:hypothetical protein Nepgr_029488 [Nepenthes gracilis]